MESRLGLLLSVFLLSVTGCQNSEKSNEGDKTSVNQKTAAVKATKSTSKDVEKKEVETTANQESATEKKETSTEAVSEEKETQSEETASEKKEDSVEVEKETSANAVSEEKETQSEETTSEKKEESAEVEKETSANAVSEEEETQPAEATPEKKEDKKKEVQSEKSTISDEETIKKKFEELQNLQKASMESWVVENSALKIIKNRTLGKKNKELTEEQKKEIEKLFPKFIVVNVEPIVKILVNYTIDKIVFSQQSKNIKSFSFDVINKETKEKTTVVLLTNNKLKVIDISVQEVSLISIMQASKEDLFKKEGDIVKNLKEFVDEKTA